MNNETTRPKIFNPEKVYVIPAGSSRRDKHRIRARAGNTQRARDEKRMMQSINKVIDRKVKKANRIRKVKPGHAKHPKQRAVLREEHPQIWANLLRDNEV